MDHRLLLAGALVLAGCGQRYATANEQRTAADPQTAFDCVKQQLKALEYKQTSIDNDELRITAVKVDPTTRRSDTQFRRIVNRLQADVSPEADGQTSITVTPQTVAEYTTQRGPTEVEEKASEQVTADAAQLVERCRS
jgi:hypothetical protein